MSKYKINTLNELEDIPIDVITDYQDTLLQIITTELIDVNKRLCLLKYGKSKIIKNQYKYFNNVKQAFLRTFDKIESFYLNKKPIIPVINFFELDCIFGAVEASMENMIVWKGKENSKEYNNIIKLYLELKPLYDTYKAEYEKSNPSY